MMLNGDAPGLGYRYPHARAKGAVLIEKVVPVTGAAFFIMRDAGQPCRSETFAASWPRR